MSTRGRILDVGFAGLAAVQLAAAAWLVPAGDQVVTRDGSPLGGLCLLHSALGVHCPLCGMTRSFVALAHGNVEAAFRFHPAGPLLFAAMVVFVGAAVIISIRRLPPLVERRNFLIAFQTVTLLCLTIGVFNIVRG